LLYALTRLRPLKALLIVALPAAAVGACALRPRMCMSAGECGPTNMCVAGRCVVKDAPSSHLYEAIVDKGVVRIVAEPTELAYLRPGDPAGAGVPSIVTLGREDGARLLLRFDVPVSSESSVVEAYLLLSRSDEVDSDPVPIALHASRIVDPWDARSISWAMQPHVEDTRSPATFVTGSGRGIVRIDVKDLVSRWPEHSPTDQGLAIAADNTSPTGMAFALASDATSSLPGHSLAAASPRLEIYLRMPTTAAASGLPSASVWVPPSSSASAKPSASASTRPLK
jgi:hypothetical protein